MLVYGFFAFIVLFVANVFLNGVIRDYVRMRYPHEWERAGNPSLLELASGSWKHFAVKRVIRELMRIDDFLWRMGWLSRICMVLYAVSFVCAIFWLLNTKANM